MARDWIVGKEARSCGEYSCASRDGVKKPGKFSLDVETGVARYGCGVCGKTTERQLRDWRERRACKCCQRVRTVKVTKFSTDSKEYFKEYCEACQLLLSARVHERSAREMRAKAAVLFEKFGVDVPRI